MKQCLNCQKEFEPKKPHGKFCSANCRVQYNRKNPQKPIPVSPCMQEMFNSILAGINAINAKNGQPPAISLVGEIKPASHRPRKKPHSGFAEGAGSIINHPIKAPIEAHDAPPILKNVQDEPPKTQTPKPKNLDELKALCPFPEKTLERSDWIRTERQKYGI